MSKKITIQKTFPVPIEQVWNAITDETILKKWYFDFQGQFQLKVGQQFEWMSGPPGGTEWLHRGIFLEIIEGKKLVHSWEYPGYSGKAIASWELESVSEKETILHFTFEAVEIFDANEPGLAWVNFEVGWNELLSGSLPSIISASH